MKQLQTEMFEDNAQYDAFVEKFKPKKTTDDCYTPPNVYDAVADWVAREYRVDRALFVRPFRPGGDYEAEDYTQAIVVDNPPFSILKQIQTFYLARGIPFFLFAPTLTLFGGNADVTFIPCGVTITYENGAEVNTSFVTNMDRFRVRTAPELYAAVKAQDDANTKSAKELPVYQYPLHVLTSAAAYQLSKYGVDYRVGKDQCAFIRAMDAQRNNGKAIFGGGFLLSERAAAERAAAKQANAIEWPLSDKERRMIAEMGGRITPDGHGLPLLEWLEAHRDCPSGRAADVVGLKQPTDKDADSADADMRWRTCDQNRKGRK